MPSPLAPGDVGNSQPPTPSTPSWKSILRLASPSKRLHARSSMLLVDTNIQNQLPVLTPSSVNSTEPRFSSNSTSSTTQSSGSVSNPTSLSSRPPPSSGSVTPAYSTSQLWSPDTQPPPPLNKKTSKSRLRLKSDKPWGLLGRDRSPNHLHPERALQPIPIEQTRSANLPFQKSAGRLIRRVASAPNTKGLFALGSRSTSAITRNGLLSPGIPPLPGMQGVSELGHNSLETSSSGSSNNHSPVQNGTVGSTRPKPTRANSAVAGIVLTSAKSKERMVGTHLGYDTPGRVPFRRTYSSHSIKVRSVEVSASSFQKIKMLGRGDVGKVYLVREKKTGKLYAMKGDVPAAVYCLLSGLLTIFCDYSPLKGRNDRKEENKAGADGARDPCDSEPSVYRDTSPFFSVGAISLFLHGVLYGRGVFPSFAKSAWKMSARGSGAVLCGRGNCSVGVLAPDGIHLSRPQTRKSVVFLLSPSRG